MQRGGRLGDTCCAPIHPTAQSDFCPQTKPLNPTAHGELEHRLGLVFQDFRYKHRAYKALAGAVQVPTESYDDLGPVGEDKRWETFGELHKYLEATFPDVFGKLEVTKVNTYGIVLRWKGSDASLRPVLVTAHQDVVPVEPATVHEWIHPPYSGYFDGEWIWGRGSCDDKSDLVASLHAIDALLKQGFKPKRTFVWAYGFDEEAAGTEGAGRLATYLEGQYGTHGFELMLDEGGSYGTPYGDDVIFAVPALSEKGYLDIRIEVTTKGGHSSVPPKHTAIGMLSSMVVAIEDHPHEPALVRGGSPYNFTMCAAVYGPEYPSHVRKLALKAAHGDDGALDGLRDSLLETFPRFEAILRTTQAVDLVQGGVKVNALPEKVSAVVNHRIAEHSSVWELQKHITDTIRPIAKKYDLRVEAFGLQVASGSGKGGRVVLSDAWGTALEPSPVTPTGKDDAYQILAGTIKATIESSEGYQKSGVKGVVVAPLLTIGNTDTRYYWNVTKNIFRYKHLHEKDRYNGAHTINEAVRAEGWLESIRFYTKFILNVDENL
ncbi:carboxypeptidase S [Lentinus brumalis]|uniref:Carboxypeptidase S n=1 Tax=Lentinus brumalis TaxID=2498619 RepID=A0A371DP50_9APHY|nr:carboxypeptidase S [Polyporus brumalis]